MQLPKSTRPAIFGAVVGGVAVAAVGFYWGGWVSASKADQIARERASDEVVKVLVPICQHQAEQDARFGNELERIKAAPKWQRPDIILELGWATMPNSGSSDRRLAKVCGEALTG